MNLKKLLLTFLMICHLVMADEWIIRDAKSLMLTGADAPSSCPQSEGLIVCDLPIPGSVEALASALDPLYLHRNLTKDDLIDLKIAVGAYFFQHDRPFVSVSIPEQEITGGRIHLVVQESKLGEIRTEGNEYFSSKQLEGYISLKRGEPIDKNTVAADLHSININPFHQADVVFTPGAKPNTTDLILKVMDRRTYRFYAGVDNTGVVGTAKTRIFAGFTLGNLFWQDQVLTYQYTTAPDFHKFQAHTLNYVVPMPHHQMLNLYGGYAAVHADLEFPGGHNTGRSYQASLRYDIPMAIGQFTNFQWQAGADFKRTNSAIFFEEIAFSLPVTPFNFSKNVNLTQLIGGYSLSCQGNRFNLQWTVLGAWSPGKWISDQSNSDFASIRPGAKNHWIYGKTEFTYEQKLPGDLLLRLYTQGQLSSQNLLPSEQLGLGGYNSVRGYNERQETKDSGVLASLEFRSPLWSLFWKKDANRFQALAFLDYGWGTDHTPIPGQPKRDYLLGAGPGVRYTYSPFVTARLDWGFKLHRRPFYTGGLSEIYFSFIGAY